MSPSDDRFGRKLAKAMSRMPAPRPTDGLRERLAAFAIEGAAERRRPWRRPLLYAGAAAVVALAAWPTSCSLMTTPTETIVQKRTEPIEKEAGRPAPLPVPSGVREAIPEAERGRTVLAAATRGRFAKPNEKLGRSLRRPALPPVPAPPKPEMVVLVGRASETSSSRAAVWTDDRGVTVKTEETISPGGKSRQTFTMRDTKGRQATMSVETHHAAPAQEEKP